MHLSLFAFQRAWARLGLDIAKVRENTTFGGRWSWRVGWLGGCRVNHCRTPVDPKILGEPF